MQDTGVQGEPDVAFPVSGKIALCYALIGLLLSVPLHVLIDWAGWQPEHSGADLNPVVLLLSGVLLAPVVETFLNFWIPISIVNRLFGGKSFAPALAWIGCVVPFVWAHYCGAHFHRSFLTALCTGVVGGTCLYLCYRRAEMTEGVSPFWTTAFCHGLFNGLVFLAAGLLIMLKVG